MSYFDPSKRHDARAWASLIVAIHAAFGSWPLFGIHPVFAILAGVLFGALVIFAIRSFRAGSRWRHARF